MCSHAGALADICYEVATDLNTILKLEVPVIVQIGTRMMPLDDIMALGPGAIIELTKSADDELDLLVNNKPIGKGTAVKVSENFGIRLNKIDPPQQRIEAMGA